MQTRKGIAAVVGLLLALTLTACGEDEASSAPQQTQGDQTS
ncbi:hypothetical protein [Gulosibacter macacae]|nr:hypothetical protein [Gulosibacter macacae]